MNKSLVAIAVILAATLVVAVTLAAITNIIPAAFALKNGNSNTISITKNIQSHSQSGHDQHYESHCVNGVCTQTGQ